jgi:hypothetical protein
VTLAASLKQAGHGGAVCTTRVVGAASGCQLTGLGPQATGGAACALTRSCCKFTLLAGHVGWRRQPGRSLWRCGGWVGALLRQTTAAGQVCCAHACSMCCFFGMYGVSCPSYRFGQLGPSCWNSLSIPRAPGVKSCEQVQSCSCNRRRLKASPCCCGQQPSWLSPGCSAKHVLQGRWWCSHANSAAGLLSLRPLRAGGRHCIRHQRRARPRVKCC